MMPTPAPTSAPYAGTRPQAPAAVPVEPKLGIALDPGSLPASLPIGGVPLRCRLGLHSWLALGMSVSGARRRLTFSFCRHCPATRST